MIEIVKTCPQCLGVGIISCYICGACGGKGYVPDIRWYKGKYRVKITKRSKGNYEVVALESIPLKSPVYGIMGDKLLIEISTGKKFTTVPRLLWRHPRNEG